MATKTITKAQRWQLIGLLALAKQHNESIRQIRDAALVITGEVSDMGHTADAVYSDESADSLLKNLNIRVK